MESTSPTRRILSLLKRRLKKWLIASAVALVAVLAFHFLFVTEKGLCAASVNFSYDGIESGFDPNGNRFDPSEIKSEEFIRQAAEALGESLTAEDVERIQDALEIRGSIPKDVLENITHGASIYGETLSEMQEVGDKAYFPARYDVILHYIDAGFTSKQATLFLSELFKAYEESFYKKYGYNPSLKDAISSVDYDAYDYIDSMEILTSGLSSVRVYLARLVERDNTRFISKETGYSFADLLGAIDTIQTEDVQWLNSYIISANISKDIDNLTDYYQYKIEDAQRTLEERESRLYTLNQSIESYVKTNALFPGLGGAANGQDDGSNATYEISQPSEMYDSLINQKIDCQTSISETREQIALFQRRIERLRNSETSGNVDILTTRLDATRKKIDQLFERIQLTADEFFKTVEMKRAFQTLQEPKSQGLGLISTVKNSISSVFMVEAALFGFYILSALTAYLPRKGKAWTEDRTSKDKAAP